jgi:serine/threonine protein kinase
MQKGDLPLTWETAFRMMSEMTAALSVLHSFKPPVYHRDIKSLNYVVMEDWTCKLTDFGLARFFNAQNLETMNKLCGTYTYAAPELFSKTHYTDKCDVFSLAIIFWELANTIIKGKYEPPYSDNPLIKKDYQILYNVNKKRLRPTWPPHINSNLMDFIGFCWAQDPAERYNTEQILSNLTLIKQDCASHPQKYPACWVPTLLDSQKVSRKEEKN